MLAFVIRLNSFLLLSLFGIFLSFGGLVLHLLIDSNVFLLL